MKCFVSAIRVVSTALEVCISRPELTMRDKTAEVPSYDTVPCCSLARIEL